MRRLWSRIAQSRKVYLIICLKQVIIKLNEFTNLPMPLIHRESKRGKCTEKCCSIAVSSFHAGPSARTSSTLICQYSYGDVTSPPPYDLSSILAASVIAAVVTIQHFLESFIAMLVQTFLLAPFGITALGPAWPLNNILEPIAILIIHVKRQISWLLLEDIWLMRLQQTLSVTRR